MIISGARDDVIEGLGGNDLICSGSGNDQVSGGVGSDQVHGGAGEDRLQGVNGSDQLWGEGGKDLILGNRGNDLLYGGSGSRDYGDGGLGDDAIAGGTGSLDQVIGGIGNDRLNGGPGAEDVLRGDHGADAFDGGPGPRDVASFAVSGFGGPIEGGQGVAVDLAVGWAERDGKDRLKNIEDVFGTAFDDVIRGSSSVNAFYGGGGADRLLGVGPSDVASGGGGSDLCDGFAQAHSCGSEAPPRSTVLEASLAGGAARTSLTVIVRPPKFVPGGPLDLSSTIGVDVDVSFEERGWSVVAAPLPLVAGEGCIAKQYRQVHCSVLSRPDAVLISGGAGDDEIEITASVPPTVSGIIHGDRGADQLLGGAGDDSIDGAPTDGPYPTDVLLGREGDDALTSGKSLYGGTGSDLLISAPCIDQTISGGTGVDSVSFARTPPGWGVSMKLGGTAVVAEGDRGSGPFSAGCPTPGSRPTRIRGSIENVEGSPEADLLIGDDGANILLGRGGADRLAGLGGGDFLVGGQGTDAILGGSGWDRLYARDGVRDQQISCGGGESRDVARLDRTDPAAQACRLLP